jgi:uncharacterized protein YbjT (DUF2867 family)
MSRVIVVAGATGLVGRECLRLASRHPGITRILALVRRFVHPSAQPERVEYVRVDFDRLDEATLAVPVDAVICALGTTMRQAGSREAFRRVDLDYVAALAARGLAWGARHFLLVSAVGANPRSRIFYNRTKGEAEAAVLALPWPSVTIVRPSLLLGPRSERRPLEELARPLGWLLPPRYRPVPAARVAAALLADILAPPAGRHVIENRDLRG